MKTKTTKKTSQPLQTIDQIADQIACRCGCAWVPWRMRLSRIGQRPPRDGYGTCPSCGRGVTPKQMVIIEASRQRLIERDAAYAELLAEAEANGIQ